MEEGTPLPRPIVEFSYKDDELGDPLVTEEHISAFGWASQQDWTTWSALALRVNDFMSGLMLGVGIKLIDFKIEIGRVWDGDFQRLIVADEISPDSLPLWDIEDRREAGQGRVPPRPRRVWRMPIPKWPSVLAFCRRTPTHEADVDQLTAGGAG